MALAILTLACFMFYATSKYFPKQDLPQVKAYKVQLLVLASAISILSLYLFTKSSDFSTALMIWLVAFMTILSAVIISVKINFKWIWAWGIFCILSLLIDLS